MLIFFKYSLYFSYDIFQEIPKVQNHYISEKDPGYIWREKISVPLFMN